MDVSQARKLIETIIASPTVSVAAQHAQSQRPLLLSPVCFQVLMAMLREEYERRDTSRRHQALTQLAAYRTALLRLRLQQSDTSDHAAGAPTLPDLLVLSEVAIDVAGVVHMFQHGDRAAQTALIESCPPSRMKHVALGMLGHQLPLYTTLMGLNILAETYCRGIDCARGIILSQAFYMLAQEAFNVDADTKHLYNVSTSARNCAIGLHALGRYDELIEWSDASVQWLETRTYSDATLTLRLYQIEAYLNLAQFDAAAKRLEQATLLLPTAHAGERHRLEGLYERYKQLAKQKVTELESLHPKTSDRDIIIANRRHMLDMVNSLAKDASPENAGLITRFTEKLEPEIEHDVPSTLAEWVTQRHAVKALPASLLEAFKDYPQLDVSQPQSIMDLLTDFISGGGKALNQSQNQKHIRNATRIFVDPVVGHDPQTIAQSVPILIAARRWSREHHLTADENEALWGLYLCYARTAREPQAIEILQALRANLEAIRCRIAEPLERAGVLREFPHLFAALCKLCHRTNRAADLLDAMEGAKGRALADVLMAKCGHITPDTLFSASVQHLPTLMQQVKAHYLSYFVDEEETYAVLVAQDGSLHTQAIPLSKATLREWSEKDVDPTTWVKPKAGIFSRKSPPLCDRLAPLVSWLDPLIESNVLQAGDHICYCPDEDLHVVPLHYVTFRNQPLVRYFSLSRIHGALALLVLLHKAPEPLRQYITVQVPAQDDIHDADKMADFSQAASWLAQILPGQLLSGAEVDMARIAQVDWTQRIVHFATHGTFPRGHLHHSQRESNPYAGSGLALAHNKQLPTIDLVATGQTNDALLTPKKILDLDFSDSHVTMQACVSGLAKEGIGGDALGLEWAVLQVGARSVLATHWDAGAHATADFSVRFYHKWLVERLPRSVAWRKTVLELMDSQPDPYYWASFSLSGDWR